MIGLLLEKLHLCQYNILEQSSKYNLIQILLLYKRIKYLYPKLTSLVKKIIKIQSFNKIELIKLQLNSKLTLTLRQPKLIPFYLLSHFGRIMLHPNVFHHLFIKHNVAFIQIRMFQHLLINSFALFKLQFIISPSNLAFQTSSYVISILGILRLIIVSRLLIFSPLLNIFVYLIFCNIFFGVNQYYSCLLS